MAAHTLRICMKITGNLSSHCNYIFVGIVLVVHVEYINKFDKIHMSLVLEIFARNWKSYRHADEITLHQMLPQKPEQRLECILKTKNIQFLK